MAWGRLLELEASGQGSGPRATSEREESGPSMQWLATDEMSRPPGSSHYTRSTIYSVTFFAGTPPPSSYTHEHERRHLTYSYLMS